MPAESPRQIEIREKIFSLVQEYHDAIEDVDKPDNQMVMEVAAVYHTSALDKPSEHYYNIVCDPNRGHHSTEGLFDIAQSFVGADGEED